jgi:hypothetical protein
MLSGDCNVCINGKLPSYSATCVECGLSRKNYKPITNADRIRAMTDEEMAEKISESMDCEVCKTMHHDDCPSRPSQTCVDFWLEWLKLGATDG